MKDITKQHDLSLGSWGPYNKEYLGVCHLANRELGASFGVQIFPAFYRRRIARTSALHDGDVRMFGANAARTAFTYRYELEWKDRVYVDAHYNITDDRLVDVDCEIVNNTDTEQSVNLFFCVGMEYPRRGITAVKTEHKMISVCEPPEGVLLIDAVDYDDILCAETLAQDGKFLAEEQADLASGMGTLIDGKKFFDRSHFLSYSLSTRADSLSVRYKAERDTALRVVVSGEERLLALPKTEGFGISTLRFSERDITNITLYATGEGVSVDALAVGYGTGRVEFSSYEYSFAPIERRVEGNSMTLRYRDSNSSYRIEWDTEPLMLRTLYTDDLERLLDRSIHNHVNTEVRDGVAGDGVYEAVRTNPVYLAPHTTAHMKFKVISFKDGESTDIKTEKQEIYSQKFNESGEPYAFSVNMMAYCALLNVVYPIYTRRGYIRHSTPGRIWNCLYTWDSGMIGVGLSTVDYKSAFETLRAYLTPVGDKHSPYIFHGSVVPTQFFLYVELVNKYPKMRDELFSLYPMMMQYYKFFSDMSKGEEQMKSGLLKTWHIFYNSGGWDDYPPQKYVRYTTAGTAEKHYANVTPAITTSLAVLIAKIMKNVSRVLGISENNSLFDADIERYSRAIQDNLWDEEAGYYSYLVHDEKGYPKEFLRYSDGTNYNMGLDGAYPYIAGVSDGYQSARVLENIKRGMMTEYGVGVVDTRAPYYDPYGYWNGSVWIPHQWILAKALLDRGEADFAARIASTALSVWKREVDETYLCFEHFMSQNGRGAGFHQFSGLSTPILNFFEMLYKPGNVTVGFTSAVLECEANSDNTELKAKLVSSEHGASAIICMNEKCKYKFTINGKEITPLPINVGAYAITLEAAGEHTVKVCPTGE